jgi:hypothetical protein
MRVEPDDLDLEKLFGVPLHVIANATRSGHLALALRSFFSVAFKRPILPPECDGILFFNTTSRRDYTQLMAKAFDACRRPKALWQHQLVPGLNLGAIVLLFSQLGRWRTVTAPAGRPLPARIYLYLCWIRCLQTGALAARISYKALVVAADMQLQESFLVQLANRRGLPTATCQHALYLDDGPLVRRDNINTINYLNTTARYFLAWGSRTKALIDSYCDCECIVVGNPAIASISRTRVGAYFYVLTDSDYRFRTYNEQLLNIARETSARTGLRYLVRFHPDNDPASYDDHPHASDDFPLAEAAFAIGHMTSQIYISMSQGVPTYRLSSTITNHPIPKALLFSDAADLQSKAVPQELFREVSKSFIAYIGENSAAHYADAFDRFTLMA